MSYNIWDLHSFSLHCNCICFQEVLLSLILIRWKTLYNFITENRKYQISDSHQVGVLFQCVSFVSFFFKYFYYLIHNVISNYYWLHHIFSLIYKNCIFNLYSGGKILKSDHSFLQYYPITVKHYWYYISSCCILSMDN